VKKVGTRVMSADTAESGRKCPHQCRTAAEQPQIAGLVATISIYLFITHLTHFRAGIPRSHDEFF
jgi:hypothetical protein